MSGICARPLEESTFRDTKLLAKTLNLMVEKRTHRDNFGELITIL
jgi:hypothetical protein